ncbi:MAG: hypothetical protein KDI15_05025, partial [Thiothrix sp.]|nr:hypothetical protein [Thiothrix sp.]
IYPLLDDNDLSETLDRHLYDKDDNPAEGGQDSQENPLDQRSKRKRPPDQNTGTPDQGPSGQPRQLQDQLPESGGQSSRAEPAADTAGSASPPPPLSHQEAEALAVQWQQRLAGAARQARQAGKLSGVMQRLVEELLQPRLPWRQLLAHYLTSLARDDYSHTRPSSRRGDPAIFPTLRSRQLQAVVALDVSGSVSDRELQECLSEINAIKGQVHAGITLIACDAAIVDGFPRRFEPWEEITLPSRIAGGGHTDFRPVFDWIDTQDQAPDLLLFFTDALGDFPAQAPHYPVLWLIKGRGQPPFGVRVALNG